jgi:hypothetical protein
MNLLLGIKLLSRVISPIDMLPLNSGYYFFAITISSLSSDAIILFSPTISGWPLNMVITLIVMTCIDRSGIKILKD